MITTISQYIKSFFPTSQQTVNQDQQSAPQNDLHPGGKMPKSSASGATVLQRKLMEQWKNSGLSSDEISQMKGFFDEQHTQLSENFDSNSPGIQLTEKKQKLASLKIEKETLEKTKQDAPSQIAADGHTSLTENEISTKIDTCDKEIKELEIEIDNLDLQKEKYIVDNLKKEFLTSDEKTGENSSIPKTTAPPQQKVQSFTPSTKNGFSNFFGLPPGKMTEIKEKFNQVEAKYKEISNINRQLANPGIDPDEKHVLEKKKSMATREAEQGLQQIEMMHTQAIQEANARLAAFLNMMMDGLKAMLALLKKGGSMQAEAIGH